MRKLAMVLALALVLEPICHAAIAVVQPTAGLPIAVTECTGTSSCSYTLGSQPVAGNAMIVAFGWLDGTTGSAPTDTASNTYSSTTCIATTGVACDGNSPAQCAFQIWYKTNMATAGSFSVTSHTAAASDQTVFAAEYSGVQTATPVDKQAQAQATSTTPAVASQSPTN